MRHPRIPTLCGDVGPDGEVGPGIPYTVTLVDGATAARGDRLTGGGRALAGYCVVTNGLLRPAAIPMAPRTGTAEAREGKNVLSYPIPGNPWFTPCKPMLTPGGTPRDIPPGKPWFTPCKQHPNPGGYPIPPPGSSPPGIPRVNPLGYQGSTPRGIPTVNPRGYPQGEPRDTTNK